MLLLKLELMRDLSLLWFNLTVSVASLQRNESDLLGEKLFLSSRNSSDFGWVSFCFVFPFGKKVPWLLEQPL